MFDLDEPEAWASTFGLAEAPLFSGGGKQTNIHRVLLDGGYGTFALSVDHHANDSRESRASWIWSSDIPHHVLVTPNKVFVIRWDDPGGERPFTRKSIEQRIEEFYRFLVLDRVTEGKRVVEHTVGLFRKMRVLIAEADIRSGANEVFLISTIEWKKLPKDERAWFRPATLNESLHGGRIRDDVFVFYPYRDNQLAFESESSLLRAVPKYAQSHLLPNKHRLQKRARFANRHWWELSERRAWLTKARPRIISKYFGERGGFAFDPEGRYAVVQGFGWTPRALLNPPRHDSSRRTDSHSPSWLAAYTALFNSRIFEMLLDAFSPQVAGGQYDLSPRYVDSIPLPNLEEDSFSPNLGAIVRQLDALGTNIRLEDNTWRNSVDEFSAMLYRTKLDVWAES